MSLSCSGSQTQMNNLTFWGIQMFALLLKVI